MKNNTRRLVGLLTFPGMQRAILCGMCSVVVTVACFAPATGLFAQEETEVGQVKPIPQTRREMLVALEKLKQRTARLPFDPQEVDSSQPSGQLGVVFNGMMRRKYLPKEFQNAVASRGNDPSLQLDYQFATELFWIVSRLNNCHYCLGHQESKLKAAGVSEAVLANLDADWSAFTGAQTAAFEFCRKLTMAPHLIDDEDWQRLAQHYSEKQILELAFLVARYNSTNRWTDALGIPQESQRDFSTQLEAGTLDRCSQVLSENFTERRSWPSCQAWLEELQRRSTRTPHCELPAPEVVQTILREGDMKEDLPIEQYERLLAIFPLSGGNWIKQLRAAHQIGQLDDSLKHQIALVAAEADSAWYMQTIARGRLLDLGFSDEQLFALLKSVREDSPDPTGTEACLRFVYRLTVQPQSISDQDLEGLLRDYTPQQVAEIVYRTGNAAFLNRFTEVAGLSESLLK
jgi:alkylhydroperoxidase family enzyme